MEGKLMTKLDELIAKYGIEKLNTMTKYPSILTYHELNKGGVRDALTKPGEMPGDDDLIIISEKVDGTNYRIVSTDDDYFIGSRDRFTYAYWDRLCTDDTARTVISTAREFQRGVQSDKILTVIFGEVYGWKIQKPRYNEGDDKTREFAIFDMWQMLLDHVEHILQKPIEGVAAWRDGNHQPWIRFKWLENGIDTLGCDGVPPLTTCLFKELPKGAKETQEWLKKFKQSKACFDGDETHGVYGQAEGVVLRTSTRNWIRKLRFEDYQKGERHDFK